MGDTLTDCFQLDSGCGLTSCVPSLCMLCKYCWVSTACPINRLWGSKGRSSDSAPEHYKIVSDQDAVLPLARVKGYVWHWPNTIFKTIAGAAVLALLNLSLWANTCDSRLTCITRCLYTAPRIAKSSLCMRYVILEIIKEVYRTPTTIVVKSNLFAAHEHTLKN